MTAFTVWKFADPEGAVDAARSLRQAERERLVQVLDYAVVSWPTGADKPTTKRSHGKAHEAGWGAFWGVLIGSLFLVPVVGGVAGAAVGAISKATQDVGITREQLEKIRTEITEGTSALFAVTDKGNLDRLGERLRMDSTLVASNLTDAERRTLIETFGGKDLSTPRG